MQTGVGQLLSRTEVSAESSCGMGSSSRTVRPMFQTPLQGGSTDAPASNRVKTAALGSVGGVTALQPRGPATCQTYAAMPGPAPAATLSGSKLPLPDTAIASEEPFNMSRAYRRGSVTTATGAIPVASTWTLWSSLCPSSSSTSS